MADAAQIKVLLVVEDQPDMQMLIAMQLRRDPRLEIYGQAASAEEALALLDDIEPGLVILDHGLEGEIMGLDAAPIIKAKAPNVTILLFTAFDMSKEATMEPAIDGFLRKDKIDRLLPTVQQLLGLPPL